MSAAHRIMDKFRPAITISTGTGTPRFKPDTWEMIMPDIDAIATDDWHRSYRHEFGHFLDYIILYAEWAGTENIIFPDDEADIAVRKMHRALSRIERHPDFTVTPETIYDTNLGITYMDACLFLNLNAEQVKRKDDCSRRECVKSLRGWQQKLAAAIGQPPVSGRLELAKSLLAEIETLEEFRIIPDQSLAEKAVHLTFCQFGGPAAADCWCAAKKRPSGSCHTGEYWNLDPWMADKEIFAQMYAGSFCKETTAAFRALCPQTYAKFKRAVEAEVM